MWSLGKCKGDKGLVYVASRMCHEGVVLFLSFNTFLIATVSWLLASMALIGRLPVSWGFDYIWKLCYENLEASTQMKTSFSSPPSQSVVAKYPWFWRPFRFQMPCSRVYTHQLSQNNSTLGHLNGNALPYLSHWEMVKKNWWFRSPQFWFRSLDIYSWYTSLFPSCRIPSSSYYIHRWSPFPFPFLTMSHTYTQMHTYTFISLLSLLLHGNSHHYNLCSTETLVQRFEENQNAFRYHRVCEGVIIISLTKKTTTVFFPQMPERI